MNKLSKQRIKEFDKRKQEVLFNILEDAFNYFQGKPSKLGIKTKESVDKSTEILEERKNANI
jgi:hypothetical protein